ncbi:MAG: bifunctional diaminohydroxyphosphoribosylaminopyrimidine deaminase/5-amino-6-(5-phosphoribosylamino)uracil reductase RibD [Ferruginibacter sp.]
MYSGSCYKHKVCYYGRLVCGIKCLQILQVLTIYFLDRHQDKHSLFFYSYFCGLTTHEKYMQRCFALAQLGAGNVAPNPMVGAVLVHNDRIIGEGYHKQYGQAHAEVNCINDVSNDDLHLIKEATMYVSLEPCAHYGKTPPCADLIIKNNILQVVVGCRDSYKEVAGKGIQKMEADGVQVITGVLEKEAQDLNRRFFMFHNLQRPYIILKWAQSENRKIASDTGGRVLISNEKTNRLVHKWRSEEAAILVGTNTALKDDPSLTTRNWKGKDPVRLVIDKELRLLRNLKLFDGTAQTIVFNGIKDSEDTVVYIKLANDSNYLPQIMDRLFQLNIQSVLVEGGARLLQSFIDEGLWDEARVITNKELQIPFGIDAPELKNYQIRSGEQILSDTIQYYRHV